MEAVRWWKLSISIFRSFSLLRSPNVNTFERDLTIFQSPFLGASLFYDISAGSRKSLYYLLSISIFRSFSLLRLFDLKRYGSYKILSISIFRSFSLLQAQTQHRRGFCYPLSISIFRSFSLLQEDTEYRV